MATATSMNTGNAREKIAEVAHHTADRVSEKADQIERNARETAANAEKQLKDAKDKAKIASEQMIGTVQQFVSEHRMMSLAAAFGAGIALAALLKR